jgi:O-methyltransferase involved in polyketide biosynthesis
LLDLWNEEYPGDRYSDREDSLALALAGPEGFAWLGRMQPVPRFGGPALYVVVRTRFFDGFLRDACWRVGVRQGILLAAGITSSASQPNSCIFAAYSVSG